MTGLTRCFWDRSMAFGWKHTPLGAPLISGDNRAFAIVWGQRLPEFPTCCGRTVTKGETNDFACLALKSHPYPYFVTLRIDIRAYFIHFENRALNRSGQGCANRSEGLLLSRLLMVDRLMPVRRAIPRWETRSRCSFSTNASLAARSRAASAVVVWTPQALQ